MTSSFSDESFADDEGYDGPAVIRPTSRSARDTDPTPDPATPGPIEVEARLRGHFEPIDGRFHWWGRLQPDERLSTSYRPGDTIALATPHGEVTARLSDVDPWGRFRVTGTGRPPFPV